MLHISRMCRMQALSAKMQPHLEFQCELMETAVGLCLGTRSPRFPDEAALIVEAWVLCYRSNQSVLTDGFPLPVRLFSVESITDTHGQRLAHCEAWFPRPQVQKNMRSQPQRFELFSSKATRNMKECAGILWSLIYITSDFKEKCIPPPTDFSCFRRLI